MQPGRPLRRLYWIDAALHRDECPNARLLAKELGTSVGTIRRDLIRLRDRFKAPVLYDPSAGAFRYGHPFVPDLPDLPLADALEIGHAWQGRGGIAGTALERMIRRKLETIAAVLAENGPLPGTRARGAESGGGARAGGASAPARAGAHARSGAHPLTGSACSSSKRLEQPAAILVRFDPAAGQELLAEGFLRREEVQLLTDGGLETTIRTRDPDALLLALLRWAPHFEIAAPAWLRRRLPVLLRGLLRHWEDSAAAGRPPRSRRSGQAGRAGRRAGAAKS